MNNEPLHLKYRPASFKEMVGQQDVVESLKSVLAKDQRPHSFLFTGPSGCGKTTLARILASKFECEPSNIIETDAATNTGIDAMRGITETLRYAGFGETPNKMIVLDECHALSKAAWQSLLKSIEEPPPHVFFALCTTDAGKVPETIRTRCLTYNLKPVRFDDLMDLLEFVAEEEDIKPLPGALELVARASDGSPRKALVMLSMVQECQSLDEVAALLEAPLENKEVIDLCRMLLDRSINWKKVQETLAGMAEQSPESIRIVVVNYLNGCLMRAKSDKEVPRLLDMLNAFSTPCNPTDKLGPILLAIGNFMYPPGG